MSNKILSGIMGLCAADALGVPVEFHSRESLRRNPVTDMRGYGTYNMPPGTWSDDTSMTLCLVDSLINGLDYKDIMEKFLSWSDEAKYTPHGEVFDMGIATRKALMRFAEELNHYSRITNIKEFANIPAANIKSSGYVVDTLEAAVWCLLNTENYKDCVLMAVNLGDDTDTVGAIAGGLAGLCYGYDNIPGEWLSVIAKKNYIEELCNRLHTSLK